MANPSAAADAHSTTATIFPQLSRTDRRFNEGQPNPGKTTYTTMEYDGYGNLTRSFDTADTGPADDVDAHIGYSATNPACQEPYIVGIPNVIDVSGNGTLMRHRESTVDCTTGNVTQVRAALANGDTAITDLEYTASGNLKAVTDPPNKTNQRYRLDYTYDSDVDTHVASITDSFGYQSRATHNLKYGLVETTTDFNGKVITNAYDTAGRVDTVTGPYEQNSGMVTIDFDYHTEGTAPYAVTRHVDRVSPDARDDDVGVIGVEHVEALEKPRREDPTGPSWSGCRLGGQSVVTSLTATRALVWSTMGLRSA